MLITDLNRLVKFLREHVPFDGNEQNALRHTISFIQTTPDCLEKYHLPGHITASSLVVDSDVKKVLLNHHRKLNKWLQLGGHVEGNPNVLEVALKEAREESGLIKLEFHTDPPVVFDVDVHTIPTYNNIPSHTHYDIRFLLEGDSHEEPVVTNESNSLKWVSIADAPNYNTEVSFQRLIKKAAIVLNQS